MRAQEPRVGIALGHQPQTAGRHPLTELLMEGTRAEPIRASVRDGRLAVVAETTEARAGLTRQAVIRTSAEDERVEDVHPDVRSRLYYLAE